MKDYIKLSEQHFDGQAEVYDENNSMYYSGPAKVSCNDTVKYLKDINLSLFDIKRNIIYRFLFSKIFT